jgi:AraC family transcriptional regulator
VTGLIRAELGRGALTVVSSYRHSEAAHRDGAEETAASHAVVFTTRGSWEYATNTGRGLAAPSRVVLMNPGSPYRVRHEPGRPLDRTIAVAFGPSLRDLVAAHPELFPERLDEALFADWSIPRTLALDILRRRLVAAAGSRSTVRALVLDVLGTELLLAVHTALQAAAGRRETPARATDGRERVAAAVEHMRSHLADDIDLAALARAAGVGPFHLTRLFRSEVGVPPVRYLRGLRLERAAQLLRTTDLSVTQISLDVGFGSLGRFVAGFRELTGVTPTVYRRQKRQRERGPRRTT